MHWHHRTDDDGTIMSSATMIEGGAGGGHDDFGRRTSATTSSRSLLQMPLFGTTTIGNDYPYSVIVISYHKTGVSFDCFTFLYVLFGE